jgi:hypothetical protein
MKKKKMPDPGGERNRWGEQKSLEIERGVGLDLTDAGKDGRLERERERERKPCVI